MSEDKNNFEQAAEILGDYIAKTMADGAKEVIENESGFHTPFLGQAEEITSKYYHRLTSAQYLKCAFDQWAKGNSKPRSPYKVERLSIDDQEIEARLSRWLKRHPKIRLVSTHTIYEEMKPIALLIIYVNRSDSEEGGCS